MLCPYYKSCTMPLICFADSSKFPSTIFLSANLTVRVSLGLTCSLRVSLRGKTKLVKGQSPPRLEEDLRSMPYLLLHNKQPILSFS